MAQVQHLRNAPITEAVIELQLTGQSEVTKGDFAPVQAAEGKGYPRVSGIFRRNGQIEVSEKGFVGSYSDSKLIGVHIVSADEKYVGSLAIDRFSVSRMRPYEDWETFKTEALRLWVHELSVLKPTGITRLGVRFLNEIDVPFPTGMQELFNLPVALAPNGRPLLAFASSCLIPDVEKDLGVNLNVFSQPPTEQGTNFRFMVDIDAFKAVSFDPKDVGGWSHILDDLRDFKNKIFFELLTDSVIARLK